jgi:biotin carboxyl carrier protein
MRYRVKVQEQWFEVEIENLRQRPILATVEGETFEVWPASELPSQLTAATPTVRTPEMVEPSVPASPTTEPGADDQAVRAPIPGVVVSVAVQPGDQVQPGQELCVIEAMKMNNPIRAARAGTIATVYVSPGQHVRHHGRLIEYAE